MRIRDFFPIFKDEGEIIASWGEAKLVRRVDGRLELKGGSRDDRVAARDGCPCIAMRQWREIFDTRLLRLPSSDQRGK
jgi:hypothetical protein